MAPTLTSASDYLEVKLLDLVFNGTTYTPPSNVFVGIFTSAPTDAGGGTQVGDRQAASFAAASGRTAATDADLTFPAVTGEVGWVGIFDAATGGNLLFWGAVDTPVDPAGDDLLIAAGGLTVTLAYGSTSGMSEALATALLDHVLRSASYSPATTVEVALVDTAGDEVTGGGYARAATSWAEASGGSVATDAVASWTNLPAVTVDELRAFEDAASGGMHLWSWEIAAKAFTAGSSATAAEGALTATID